MSVDRSVNQHVELFGDLIAYRPTLYEIRACTRDYDSFCAMLERDQEISYACGLDKALRAGSKGHF